MQGSPSPGIKSAFGQSEIMVVGNLCGPFGQKPSPAKVEVIFAMKHDCNSVTEVRRFLGACAFYHIWIPHYAHIAEPLYGVALFRDCVWKGRTTGVLDQEERERERERERESLY